MVWSTDVDDAKMFLDIPFRMNYVLINQLALNLVDTCVDITLQILCIALQKLGRLTAQKSPNFGL